MTVPPRKIFTIVKGVASSRDLDAIPSISGARIIWLCGPCEVSPKTNGHAKFFRMPQRLYEKLFGQLEVDGDLRLNLNRLAVEQVRLVFPLFNRIRGGLGQFRITAQHLDASDVACF
jgi:hypothetical protein